MWILKDERPAVESFNVYRNVYENGKVVAVGVGESEKEANNRAKELADCHNAHEKLKERLKERLELIDMEWKEEIDYFRKCTAQTTELLEKTMPNNQNDWELQNIQKHQKDTDYSSRKLERLASERSKLLAIWNILEG